jgi:hypothetical protein
MDLSDEGRGIIFDTIEPFPNSGHTGWAVLADPDGCPSFYPQNPACPSSGSPPVDETAIQFTNDIVRLVDEQGRPDISQTGASTLLPSLVLLADRGMGVIVGDAPTFADMGRKNLAAQVNSVSYALADDCPLDGPCQTSIVAQMLVPRGLLLPQIYIDQAYEAACFQSSAAYVEVGGTLTQVSSLGAGWESEDISPFVNFLTVLVNGEAPEDVVDSNGDGFVNEKDLEYDGYVLLSKPETFTIEMHFQERDWCNFTFFNLDENDHFECEAVIPSGSVSRTPPPR